MKKPYHLTATASQGNAFTYWRDGAPSCMAPKKGTSDSSLCSIAASKAVDKGRAAGKTVDIVYSTKVPKTGPVPTLRTPKASQYITLDKTPQASADKQAKIRKAKI